MPLLLPFLLAPASTFCTRQLMLPDVGVWFRLLLLAPLLEEWVVRAGLQEWLIVVTARAPATSTRRRSGMSAAPALPVLVSAAAFGLLHLGSGWLARVADSRHGARTGDVDAAAVRHVGRAGAAGAGIGGRLRPAAPRLRMAGSTGRDGTRIGAGAALPTWPRLALVRAGARLVQSVRADRLHTINR